jgi:anti-anti-sigma factor
MLQISTREEKGCTLVTVGGRMDAVTSPEFEAKCGACLDAGARKVIIDLSGLEYISSAGLRSVLVIAKRVKSTSGALALFGLKGVVDEVFTISGFRDLLPIAASLDEALAKV